MVVQSTSLVEVIRAPKPSRSCQDRNWGAMLRHCLNTIKIEKCICTKCNPPHRLCNRYDVLFMTEPLDELTVQAIGEYKGKSLTDLGKENVDLAGDADDKIKQDEQSEETKGKFLKFVSFPLSLFCKPLVSLRQCFQDDGSWVISLQRAQGFLAT